MTLSEKPADLVMRTAYEASKERFPEGTSLNAFAESMRDWTLRGVFNNGQCIGAVMDKDGTVHISILPEYRKQWASKGLLRDAIQGAMKNGIVQTFVKQGDAFRAEFAKRLGFRFAGVQGTIERYEHV